MAKKTKHTGKLLHEDMGSYMQYKGKGKDKHAHSSHHQMNKKMGMPEGMSPKDDGCGGSDGADCEGPMQQERDM